METPDFPPNSEASRQPQGKGLQKVTEGTVTRKKRSLRKQFMEVFVAGNARDAAHFVIFDVALPAVKDMVVEIGQGFLEKLVYGESRRRRLGSTTPYSGQAGYVSYNQMSMRSPESRLMSAERVMSRQARARHDFDEIVLDSRSEAEEVINRLYDLVSRYDAATVADLYELVGLDSTHIDHKWGWTDLRGSGVSRIRDGYLLDLPDPEPLH